MREQHECRWWQRYMSIVSAIAAAEPREKEDGLCGAKKGVATGGDGEAVVG